MNLKSYIYLDYLFKCFFFFERIIYLSVVVDICTTDNACVANFFIV